MLCTHLSAEGSVLEAGYIIVCYVMLRNVMVAHFIQCDPIYNIVVQFFIILLSGIVNLWGAFGIQFSGPENNCLLEANFHIRR
jgi:hypothetical protein